LIFIRIDETLRRVQTGTITTPAYQRLNRTDDEFDGDTATNSLPFDGKRAHPTSIDTNVYAEYDLRLAELIADRPLKILLEYACAELSVTSSIEPLFDKLGQTVFVSGMIKKFEAKILPNQSIDCLQALIINTSTGIIDPSILSIVNLNIQSMFRQLLEPNQLHSANVQVGIRIQRIQQQVNLSLLRLIHQFYTVVNNGIRSSDTMNSVTADETIHFQESDFVRFRSETVATSHPPLNTDIEHRSIPNNVSSPLHTASASNAPLELDCWRKLRELVDMHRIPSDMKSVSTSKSTNRSTQDTVDKSSKVSSTEPQSNETTTSNETLLLSSFGWLIIDDIKYGALLGELKVDGCMSKVQGSATLSQRLRTQQQSTTNKSSSKKYEHCNRTSFMSLIVCVCLDMMVP
jgi:hypothetical protein